MMIEPERAASGFGHVSPTGWPSWKQRPTSESSTLSNRLPVHLYNVEVNSQYYIDSVGSENAHLDPMKWVTPVVGDTACHAVESLVLTILAAKAISPSENVPTPTAYAAGEITSSLLTHEFGEIVVGVLQPELYRLIL